MLPSRLNAKAMSKPTIHTIGYGNRDWQSFLNLLQKYGITLLVDIRTLPFSRFNPAFRQASLEKSLKESGIRYAFLGAELGGRPKDETLYNNDKPDYDRMEASPAYKEGIAALLGLAEQGGNVCIMCSELKPENCHRKNLVGRTLVGRNVSVKHIDEKGNIRVQQDESEGRLF